MDEEIKKQINESLKSSVEGQPDEELLSPEDTLKFSKLRALDRILIKKLVQLENDFKAGLLKEPGKYQFLVKVEMHKSFDRFYLENGIKEKILKKSF